MERPEHALVRVVCVLYVGAHAGSACAIVGCPAHDERLAHFAVGRAQRAWLFSCRVDVQSLPPPLQVQGTSLARVVGIGRSPHALTYNEHAGA